jgi:hypothetical protein
MNWRVLVFTFLFPALVAAQPNPANHYKHPVIPAPQLTLEYVAPPLTPVPAGEDKIQAVQEGEVAPFTGQLMDAPTALRWAHYLQQAKLRLSEDVIATRRTCNEQEYGQTIEKDLRSRVLLEEQKVQDLQTEMNNPGFFDSNGVWYGIGVLSTVVVIGLGAFVVSQVK